MNIGELGALIHQCALGLTPWTEGLKAVGAFTGSARGQLIGFTSPTVEFNIVTDFESIPLHQLDGTIGGDPAFNFRIAAGIGAAPLQVIYEAHYDRAKRGLRNESFVDFCDRADIVHGCQTVLAQSHSGVVGLAVLRTRADGVTRAKDRKAFAAIAPLVRSAVELQWAIEAQGQALLLGSFDALDKAALVLDGQGRVLVATPAAELLLRETTMPRLREGRLICDHPQPQAALDQAIGAVLAGFCSESSLLMRQPSAMPLVITVHAFRPPETNIRFRPRAIVVLRSMAQASARAQSWLRMAGLTPAEIEVALALGQGMPRHLIAEQRSAQLSTVRQQIKTVFAKLGVRRETEFVTLLGEKLHR